MYNYIWDDLTISGKESFCSSCSGTCGDDDNDLYNCSHCNPPDLVLQKSTLETSRRYFGTSHLSKQIGRICFSLYPEKKNHEAHYMAEVAAILWLWNQRFKRVSGHICSGVRLSFDPCACKHYTWRSNEQTFNKPYLYKYQNSYIIVCQHIAIS